jgi:hypothetical protein
MNNINILILDSNSLYCLCLCKEVVKYVCSTSGTYATVLIVSLSHICDIVCMSSAEICWELLNYIAIIMQWI